MSNMEYMANNVLPIIVKFLIASGVTVCLLSIIVAFYAWIKKKSNPKVIKTYFIPTFFSGMLISIGGIMGNFMANLDIDFSTYKTEIPSYLVVSLIAFSIIMNSSKRNSN